jgi:hypothetical protein
MLAGLVIGFIAGQLIGVAAVAFCLAARGSHDADGVLEPSAAGGRSGLVRRDGADVLAGGRAALGLASTEEGRAAGRRPRRHPLDHGDAGDALAYR